MNTNIKENEMNEMNELNLNELEQVSAGILPILLGLGALAIGGLMIAFYPRK